MKRQLFKMQVEDLRFADTFAMIFLSCFKAFISLFSCLTDLVSCWMNLSANVDPPTSLGATGAKSIHRHFTLYYIPFDLNDKYYCVILIKVACCTPKLFCPKQSFDLPTIPPRRCGWFQRFFHKYKHIMLKVTLFCLGEPAFRLRPLSDGKHHDGPFHFFSCKPNPVYSIE